MSFFMPRIEKSWYSEEEWNTWMTRLVDHRGLLKTAKPIYFHSKDALIVDAVFIKLMEYLYRNKKFITPYYCYLDPFYNQVEKRKALFSLKEHIEITQISWDLTFKTLKQLY